jgi:DUF4097 and DUF4098 domain-containing protein YvlB
MRVRAFTITALALAAMAGSLGAQQRVDVRRATGGSGPLDVHLISGEVRLVGWNRNEVHVTGEMSEDGDRIEVAPQGEHFVVRVQPRRGRGGDAELVIRYPAGRSLQVTTVSADVDVGSPGGAMQVNTVSGSLSVDGSPASLEFNTRSGDLQLGGSTGRLIVNTINGDVQVSGAVRGEADVHTVSGDVHLRGGVGRLRVQAVTGEIVAAQVAGAAEVQTVSGGIDVQARTLSGEFNSVSGDITLRGAPMAGRTLEVHTHSGTVDLRVPRGTNADVEISTWSGEIATRVSGARAGESSRRERQVRLGRGGARVQISTFSGGVRLADQ